MSGTVTITEMFFAWCEFEACVVFEPIRCDVSDPHAEAVALWWCSSGRGFYGVLSGGQRRDSFDIAKFHSVARLMKIDF